MNKASRLPTNDHVIRRLLTENVWRALGRFCLLLGLMVFLVHAQGTARAFEPVDITDATGQTVHFTRPAQRIIPLYGAFAELLLALDARDLLVARTQADAHIPALATLPAVGTHMRPNAECIVAQRPDLVIQLAGREDARLQTAHLRSLGLTVLHFSLNSFADMFAVTETLGRLTDRARQAQALIRHWQERLQAVQIRHAGKKPVRLFYEVRYPNLLAAGGKSIIAEIIALAGGVNVVSQDKKLVRYNEESLVAADPDAYIIQKGPMNPAPVPLSQRPHYQNLRAVRHGRVLVVPEAHFARPGPQAVDAVEELSQWLHPESSRSRVE